MRMFTQRSAVGEKTPWTQRKAVGSSSSSGSHADGSGKSTSQGRRQHSSQQSSYESQELFHSSNSHQEVSDALDEAQDHGEVMYSRFLSQHHEPETETASSFSDDPAFSDDEYPDALDTWEQVSQSLSPAYNFPGTWTAALHDTTAALSQVRNATSSYAQALCTSGLGRATLSIGAAALHSTNNYALSLAEWSLSKTGLVPNELPAPVRAWVARRQEGDRRRREARIRRHNLRHFQEASNGLFIEGSSRFVIDLHDTDASGEFLDSVPMTLERREEVESGDVEYEDPFELGDEDDEDDGEDDEESEEESVEDSVKSVDDEASDGEKQNDGLVRLFEFDD
ncbi:hypothetical protein ACJQWK_04922 [Exserohilum turcicum]|uniref:Uncharacterized protein n=1 Tax=Exserohilum turcicum (strain 28A) TaxID=671987 RepID=R0IAW7_EXST2|nr:uncharacterized protein SETTUDRAFT_22432 [Exserohilum turcica Et28A]EOA82441.1 hypothetical protein SETTUDRAFT_22432 [Exserohilum turcica Et28A]